MTSVVFFVEEFGKVDLGYLKLVLRPDVNEEPLCLHSGIGFVPTSWLQLTPELVCQQRLKLATLLQCGSRLVVDFSPRCVRRLPNDGPLKIEPNTVKVTSTAQIRVEHCEHDSIRSPFHLIQTTGFKNYEHIAMTGNYSSALQAHLLLPVSALDFAEIAPTIQAFFARQQPGEVKHSAEALALDLTLRAYHHNR